MAMSKVAVLDLRSRTNHHSSRHGKKIDRIVVHHMAGKLTWQQCLAAFNSRNGSATYIIDVNGVCAYVVDEQYRPWTTSTYVIDDRSITIEVANDEDTRDNPNCQWRVSDSNMAILLDLLTDICQRYGISELTFTGNKNTSILQAHRWWHATACPGPYLYGKFPYIASEVTRRLKSGAVKNIYRVQVGAFHIKTNASRMLNKAIAAGFSGFITNDGKLYRVQLGAFGNPDNANAYLKKVKAAGFDAFIIQKTS